MELHPQADEDQGGVAGQVDASARDFEDHDGASRFAAAADHVGRIQQLVGHGWPAYDAPTTAGTGLSAQFRRPPAIGRRLVVCRPGDGWLVIVDVEPAVADEPVAELDHGTAQHVDRLQGQHDCQQSRRRQPRRRPPGGQRAVQGAAPAPATTHPAQADAAQPGSPGVEHVDDLSAAPGARSGTWRPSFLVIFLLRTFTTAAPKRGDVTGL